ncbi:MAG TPA: universal stress protein [Anaerolineales bacterium]|nr:universal stress protein [Anaerolineales bacterium]
MSRNSFQYQTAIQDFQRAKQRASIQEVLARFTGKSTELLSYDEVAEKLKLRVRTERGVQHIPLDAIVGSVGRTTEFTRTFLPRRAGDRQRWAGVKAAFMDMDSNLPPIEVYKVGEVYFVVDGNHRVSIARQEGFKSLEARVIEFQTEIKITPDVQPDDLIIKAEHADFLDQTHIHELRPNVDLTVTTPGQHEKMLKEICVQEFILERERKQLVEFQEAVEAWYDNEYIPLTEAIRDRGLLHWFPERTITDLYVWISENRAALEEELGWEIKSDVAVTDLIMERSVKSEPGTWRKARTATRYTDQLFEDILVPLSGNSDSWNALDQAIIVAQHEEAKLHGLHIVDTLGDTESESTLGIKTRFDQTCKDAGVDGSLAIDVGDITNKICERAVLTDLIVLKNENRSSTGTPVLDSSFRTIIERSSRPLLTVPLQASHCKRALLAYDGTDRAKEALFVATYLAEIWKTKLIVFTGTDGKKVTADVQDHVRKYLDIHEVEAEYVLSDNSVTDSLMQMVDEQKIDLILMGSHSRNILQRVFVGSALDHILKQSKVPMFICR